MTKNLAERIIRPSIARGAADMTLTTRFETDYGLRWSPERLVWTAQDGFAYDGRKTQDAA